VSLFWDNANKLMESAMAAVQNGFASTEPMTVLIGQEGGIHIVSQSDWPLDRLAEERGARMAYRVSHNNGRVAVDGIQGATVCHLETESEGARAARTILRDRPSYLLTAPDRSLR
jgi:hypothetical protein